MTRSEKLFVFFAILAGMAIAGEYGIVRPASSSLFITAFSAKALPWVWFATLPINLFVIALYNRYLPLMGPLKMLGTLSFFVVGINVLTAIFGQTYPSLIFLQFAWKDIYILLMFKQLWSMIHSTIRPDRAKYLYGFIFGMGTVSSLICSQIPTHFAVELGSASLLYFSVPLYVLLFFSYRMALKRSGVQGKSFDTELPSNALEGFSLIRKSSFMTGIMLLVVLMQVSAGLLEYQFNAHLELKFLDQDLRTAYCGQIMGYTNLLSTCLQFIGGFFLIQWLGVKKGHFMIPLVLCASGLLSVAYPTFAMVSFSFVFVKAIDFSLFGVLREMLYIPLTLDEKYRAKAVIDVFAYRSSKALVSITVLAIQAMAGAAILFYVNTLSIALFIAWMGLVWFMFKKRPELASN